MSELHERISVEAAGLTDVILDLVVAKNQGRAGRTNVRHRIVGVLNAMVESERRQVVTLLARAGFHALACKIDRGEHWEPDPDEVSPMGSPAPERPAAGTAAIEAPTFEVEIENVLEHRDHPRLPEKLADAVRSVAARTAAYERRMVGAFLRRRWGEHHGDVANLIEAGRHLPVPLRFHSIDTTAEPGQPMAPTTRLRCSGPGCTICALLDPEMPS